MQTLFRVSASSHSASLAGAIAKSVRDGKTVVLQSIGAGAANQAVKAIVMARGFLLGDGLDIVCASEFVDLEIRGTERTAVRIYVDQPGRPMPSAVAIAPKALSAEANPSAGLDARRPKMAYSSHAK
jgi:stage V sporulation protein S